VRGVDLTRFCPMLLRWLPPFPSWFSLSAFSFFVCTVIAGAPVLRMSFKQTTVLLFPDVLFGFCAFSFPLTAVFLPMAGLPPFFLPNGLAFFFRFPPLWQVFPARCFIFFSFYLFLFEFFLIRPPDQVRFPALVPVPFSRRIQFLSIF